METERRRQAIVAEAQYSIANHKCAICDTASMCDTMLYAHNVLALNDIFVERLSKSSDAEALEEARKSGKMEAAAQALAVIGRAEGEYRTLADGDERHPALELAETHRKLATTIRTEVVNPEGRSALEVQARAEEANELSDYVKEVSAQFRQSGSADVASALAEVAQDISKGTDGISKLKKAADSTTSPGEVAQLLFDPDADVRWWAAQNPVAPQESLMEAAFTEGHPMVLAALVANPQLPENVVTQFVRSPRPEVAQAARLRLGV